MFENKEKNSEFIGFFGKISGKRLIFWNESVILCVSGAKGSFCGVKWSGGEP